MSRFLTELDLRDDLDGAHMELLAPLLYESDVLGRLVTVPAGFVTDFASIPRALWVVLPPHGRYDKAATVHDALYQHNGVTRHQADRVLNEAMGVLGVGRLTRWAIYSGIVAGGWVAWNRYRSADHAAT